MTNATVETKTVAGYAWKIEYGCGCSMTGIRPGSIPPLTCPHEGHEQGQGSERMLHIALANLAIAVRKDGDVRGVMNGDLHDALEDSEKVLNLSSTKYGYWPPVPMAAGQMSSLNGDTPCADCGAGENIIWFTDNVFWNAVCPDDNPILCVMCFARRAEDMGYRPKAWRVIPEWDWVQESEQTNDK